MQGKTPKFFINLLISTVLISAMPTSYANAANYAGTAPSSSQRYVPVMKREVNFIGLGGLEIGRDWGVGTEAERRHPDAAIAQKTLATAVALGVNYIDTANAYHLSQQRIGEYIENSGLRAKLIIGTKAGNQSVLATDSRCQLASYDGVYCEDPASDYDFSAAAITKDVNTSLQQLQVNYLDVVFIHMGDDPEKVLKDGQALAALKALKKAGKIHYIGVSLDKPKIAEQCIQSGDFDAIELEYNLLNQTNAKAIAMAHQKGMFVVVRGGLATGLLTPKIAPYLNDKNLPYHQQIKDLLNLTHGNYQQLMALELAFLYNNPNISVALIGSSNPQQLTEDVQLLNHFNNPQLLQQAEQLMAKYQPGPFTDSLDAYFAKKDNAQQKQAHKPKLEVES